MKWVIFGFLFMIGADVADFLFDIFNHIFGSKIRKKIMAVEKKVINKKKEDDKIVIKGFYRNEDK